MAKAISVRLDDDALRALSVLEADETSRSNAIRAAIVAEAQRRQRSDQVRADVAALAADPHDRAEMAAVLEVMEELGDPW